MATGTVLDSIIELNNQFVLASQKENAALENYKKQLAWENELERQYNYHLSNNDSYNANIIKPQLNTQRGVRENAGREWETAKSVAEAAYEKLEDAKKNLSNAETQAVNSQLTVLEAQANQALIEAQTGSSLAKQKLAEDEQKALVKKIVVYSAIGLGVLTVVIVAIWAYKKYLVK